MPYVSTTHLLRSSYLGNLAQPTAGSGGCLQWLGCVASPCLAGRCVGTSIFLPSWSLTFPSSCLHRRGAAAQLREKGDRKELLLFIVPSSAGSDNNSFLPYVSGLAVGPMGQGCSHRATAQFSEGMVIWDWHWGGSDPWAVLAAEGPWGCG